MNPCRGLRQATRRGTGHTNTNACWSRQGSLLACLLLRLCLWCSCTAGRDDSHVGGCVCCSCRAIQCLLHSQNSKGRSWYLQYIAQRLLLLLKACHGVRGRWPHLLALVVCHLLLNLGHILIKGQLVDYSKQASTQGGRRKEVRAVHMPGYAARGREGRSGSVMCQVCSDTLTNVFHCFQVIIKLLLACKGITRLVVAVCAAEARSSRGRVCRHAGGGCCVYRRGAAAGLTWT